MLLSIVSIPIVLIFKQVIDFFRHRKYFNIVIRWVDAKTPLRGFSLGGILLQKKGEKLHCTRCYNISKRRYLCQSLEKEYIE